MINSYRQGKYEVKKESKLAKESDEALATSVEDMTYHAMLIVRYPWLLCPVDRVHHAAAETCVITDH